MSDEKKKIRKIPRRYLESTLDEEEVTRAIQLARQERLDSDDPYRGADISEAPRVVAKRTGGGKERGEEE